MKDADKADDLAFFQDTPAQAKFLPYSLEQAAGDINLYMNEDKMDFMHFKNDTAISK